MHENKISKKKFSRNNTKIFSKNTHWRVETQLPGEFANIGKSATEKQKKKKLNQSFSLKASHLCQTCPTLSNRLYFLW